MKLRLIWACLFTQDGQILDPPSISRFWCWVLCGHCWDTTGTRRQMGRSMNRCVHCGYLSPGPD